MLDDSFLIFKIFFKVINGIIKIEQIKPIGIKIIEPSAHFIPFSNVPSAEIPTEISIRKRFKNKKSTPKNKTVHLFLKISNLPSKKSKYSKIPGNIKTKKGIEKTFIL